MDFSGKYYFYSKAANDVTRYKGCVSFFMAEN